jgi:hypothetical protein
LKPTVDFKLNLTELHGPQHKNQRVASNPARLDLDPLPQSIKNHPLDVSRSIVVVQGDVIKKI